MTRNILDCALCAFPASLAVLPDPRIFSPARDAVARNLASLAEESLAAPIMARKDELDETLRASLRELAERGEFTTLARVLDEAPSVPIRRHLWRRLDEVLRDMPPATDGIATRVFALPLILVLGSKKEDEIEATIGNVEDVIELLQKHAALAGNRNFGLSNALFGAEVLAVAKLDRLLVHPQPAEAQAFECAPLAVAGKQETVHLRFLVGAAVAAAGQNLFADVSVGNWGMPLAKMLAAELARPEVTALVLPRAPLPPLAALHQGRLAQREVALQLFASNAIRKLRAEVGEPTAVLSTHRMEDGQGELRVSLSSPFEPRSAEGFRIALLPMDRIEDVAQTVVDLLRDCRLRDIRMLTAVQPDREAATGLTLLFKPENIGPNEALKLVDD